MFSEYAIAALFKHICLFVFYLKGMINVDIIFFLYFQHIFQQPKIQRKKSKKKHIDKADKRINVFWDIF